MNILIACQTREYGTSAAKASAIRLRDVLRGQGMRVFLDAYPDDQVAQDAALATRIRTVVQRADAMILVLDDARSFWNSRQYEQWVSFENENQDGLFAVYAMQSLDVNALPQEFTERYVLFDAPGAMQQLAQDLQHSYQPKPVQQQNPALQTKAEGAPRKNSQKKKKRVKIMPLVLVFALILTAAIGIPAFIKKRKEARIAAEIAAREEAERLAQEQALYEEQHRTMRVTIIEGSTVEQMAVQLEEEIGAEGGEFSAEVFLDLCRDGLTFVDYDFVAQSRAVESAPDRFYALEGYLFPDTYEIYVHTTEEEMIRKMLDRFDEIISKDEFVSALSSGGMTLDEAVTLASVVQKEGTGSSFHQISAVFHNRLSIDMALQSDVTAQYVTGKQSLVMSTDDVSVDSPYNTYVYTGLPAGPIANPGFAALYAAVAPDADMIAEGYLFFVLTDPSTGVIAYSKTYAEHEAIADQYAHLWR